MSNEENAARIEGRSQRGGTDESAPEDGAMAVEPSSRRAWLRRMAVASIAGVGAAGAYAGWSARLEVTTHRASLGLDRERRPLRVALITDLHLTGGREDRRPFLDAVRRATPDLILIAGDTIDRAESLELVSVLRALEAPLGKWAVPGNWDLVATDLSTLRRTYDLAGVRLLVNEHVSVGPIHICGVDDLVEGAPEVGAVEDAVRRGPTILLTHCPGFVDQVASASTDTHRGLLALAGHTHGGQIAPFGFVAFTPPGSGSYVAGWYRPSDIPLYVSRGIGTSLVPIRMGSRPELAMFELV